MPFRNHTRSIFAVFFLGLGLLISGCTYYMGNSWIRKFPDPENSPASRAAKIPMRQNRGGEGKKILELWASKSLPNWEKHAKTSPTRILLAKLLLQQDLETANQYLQQAQPTGKAGSTSPLYKKGDYDFTEIVLSAILCEFANQPEILLPETRNHLAGKLLVEEGHHVSHRAPHTLGLIKETENHILMTETTRHLKNQFLLKTGSPLAIPVEKHKKHETWLSDHLEEMAKTGFFEFNGNPYMGYTLTALLVLANYTDSQTLRTQCHNLLYEANFAYVLSSNKFRRYPPFRRRMERAGDPSLLRDPHSTFMRVWWHREKQIQLSPKKIPYGMHHALIASATKYSLPPELVEGIEGTEHEYFARLGHGYRASPEIYSAGPGWLLSAGGVQRTRFSQLSARPIVLILEDDADSLRECFHIFSQEPMKKWNHTGVGARIAVAKGKVHIPEGQKALVQEEGWQIYKPLADEDLLLGVWQDDEMALIVLFPEEKSNPTQLLNQLIEQNPSTKIHRQFRFPNGNSFQYDLNAPKNRWIITHQNQTPTDRKFDFWPRWKIE